VGGAHRGPQRGNFKQKSGNYKSPLIAKFNKPTAYKNENSTENSVFFKNKGKNI